MRTEDLSLMLHLQINTAMKKNVPPIKLKMKLSSSPLPPLELRIGVTWSST